MPKARFTARDPHTFAGGMVKKGCESFQMPFSRAYACAYWENSAFNI